MKNVLSISFSFLILAAGHAFALPKETTAPGRHPALQDALPHSGTPAPAVAVDLGKKGVAANPIDAHAPIYVAEVRKEFGSKYQRY